MRSRVDRRRCNFLLTSSVDVPAVSGTEHGDYQSGVVHLEDLSIISDPDPITLTSL